MIKTALLEPEVFTSDLKVVGTRTVEKDVSVEVKTGLFGRTKTESRKEEREINVYDLDEELISKFPKDVIRQITVGGHTRDGYPYYGFSLHHFPLYMPHKEFTRGFPFTLNEFYKKNKITQYNLISLEYCKKECDNTCKIISAYVTWDNEK